MTRVRSCVAPTPEMVDAAFTAVAALDGQKVRDLRDLMWTSFDRTYDHDAIRLLIDLGLESSDVAELMGCTRGCVNSAIREERDAGTKAVPVVRRHALRHKQRQALPGGAHVSEPRGSERPHGMAKGQASSHRHVEQEGVMADGIADPLRAEADALGWHYWQWDEEVRKLREIADEIDAEHERLMREREDQCKS